LSLLNRNGGWILRIMIISDTNDMKYGFNRVLGFTVRVNMKKKRMDISSKVIKKLMNRAIILNISIIQIYLRALKNIRANSVFTGNCAKGLETK